MFFKVRSFWLGSAQDLANCTKVEQSLLCVQAETSAKYKLLAVKQRCFALQIIVVGKGAVKEIVTFFFFLEIMFYEQIIYWSKRFRSEKPFEDFSVFGTFL